MNIVKQKSGKYAAKILTPHGQRTIHLGATNLFDAKQVVKDTGLVNIEQLARSGQVRKELLAQVILGRKLKVAEAIEEFAGWIAARSSPKHVANILFIIRAWVREMKLEKTGTHDLKESHIDRWINDKDSTDKASNRKLKLSGIKRFLDFCSVRNYIAGNPAAEIRIRYDLLTHEQKETIESVPFSEREYHLLLQSFDYEAGNLKREIEQTVASISQLKGARPHEGTLQQRLDKLLEKVRRLTFWKLACELSYGTGLRLGDICQLERASLQHGGRLVVHTDKTNARISVPMKPGLQAALRRMSDEKERFVFPQEAAEYADLSRRSNFSKWFDRYLRQRAGIEGHTFHDLRHSYATEAKKRGLPTAHISQRLGHASEQMTQRYIHG